MKKTIEIEGEFSELILNPTEIANGNEHSEMLRKEHDRWKNEIDKNRCKDFSRLQYWEKVSICTAL